MRFKWGAPWERHVAGAYKRWFLKGKGTCRQILDYVPSIHEASRSDILNLSSYLTTWNQKAQNYPGHILFPSKSSFCWMEVAKLQEHSTVRCHTPNIQIRGSHSRHTNDTTEVNEGVSKIEPCLNGNMKLRLTYNSTYSTIRRRWIGFVPANSVGLFGIFGESESKKHGLLEGPRKQSRWWQPTYQLINGPSQNRRKARGISHAHCLASFLSFVTFNPPAS